MAAKTETRLEKIVGLVRQNGEIDGFALAGALEVSIATIRRDLTRLEQRGLLRRTHGGATVVEPLLYEPFRHDSSFQEQIDLNAEEKLRIARAAAALVEEGEVISLTAGTTTTEVVRNLRNRRGLTVVTSTVNVAMELSRQKEIEVFVTGGYMRGHWFSLVGPAAIQNAKRILPAKMFIGVNGIDAVHGLTSKSAEEAELIAVMIGQARRRIVVADHSKIGVVAPHAICGLEAVDVFITGGGASDESVAPFAARGIEIVRV